MPQNPRVYRWEPSGHPMSQYEIWPGVETRLGDDGLIFSSGVVNPKVAECFESIEKVGLVEVPLGDKTRVFQVSLGRNLKSWTPVPAPPPAKP
jgi:hypothetical protein